MADREKVIKGLEYCITHYNCRNLRTRDCPYLDLCKPIQNATGNTLMRDALSLLKEQEAVEPIINKEKFAFHNGTFGEVSMAFCGNCRKGIDIRDHSSDGYNYCPYCGRPVKWK